MSPLEHVAIDDCESTAGVRQAHGVIGDEWGIAFAHGSVVTATMLHAAGLALAREDLQLRSGPYALILDRPLEDPLDVHHR